MQCNDVKVDLARAARQDEVAYSTMAAKAEAQMIANFGKVNTDDLNAVYVHLTALKDLHTLVRKHQSFFVILMF